MKKYLSILGMTLAFFACTKEQPVALQNNDPEAVIFTSTFSKVLVDGATSTWQLGDSIGVFSYESSAAAGTSVSANFQYKSTQAGASTTFTPASSSVEASDKYIAYYPYTELYPNKLNADSGVGFGGSTAGVTPVTDYRHIPFGVNSGYTMKVDPATHKAAIPYPNLYYAVANAPVTPGTPVALTFKPVLSVLEFGFLGKGKIAAFTAEYKDKTTDAIGPDKSNWLSAKGIFDASTSTLITTNYSSSAFCRIIITVDGGAELNTTEATRFPMVVGRFHVTKGLNLIFTDDHGYTFTKTIWEGKEYSGINGEGTSVHLYQKVNVPYLVADKDTLSFTDAGESKTITLESTAGDWTLISKPAWISTDKSSGASGETLTITAGKNSSLERSGEVVLGTTNGPRCYITANQAAGSGSDYYKVSKNDITWTDSKVKYIIAPSGDSLAIVTKEFLGASNPVLTTKIYKIGFKNGQEITGDFAYVCAADSSISLKTPSGTIGDAAYVDMVLASPSGESNPLVKVSKYLLTINGYKTSKNGDGSDIPIMTTLEAVSTAKVYKGSDFYIYNAYAIGGGSGSFTEGFAPTGWKLFDATDWEDITEFTGNTTTNAYTNIMTCGLFTRHTYKLNGKATSQLVYPNTWSSEANTDSKHYMYMVQKDKVPAKNGQNNTAMFEVVIYKTVE